MRKMNLLITAVGTLMLASVAFGAEIADIAWDKSNLETLHSFGAEAVASGPGRRGLRQADRTSCR